MKNTTRTQSALPEALLYHYTSQAGLQGIVNSGVIWATNILYLNDSKELLNAIDVARWGLNHVFEHYTLSKKETEFLHQIDDRFHKLEKYKITKSNVFVCSFSESPDELSQWRGYCPDGNGYSIGFDFNSGLLDRVKGMGYKLEKCVYAKDALEKDPLNDEVYRENEVTLLLKSFLEKFREGPYQGNNFDGQIKNLLDAFDEEFLQLAVKVKHPAFKDEEEWRLFFVSKKLNDEEEWFDGDLLETSFTLRQNDSIFEKNYLDMEVATENLKAPKILYRPGKSMLIPCIEVNLRDDSGFLNIPEVWVGPTPHPALAQSSVRNFLISKGVYAYGYQFPSLPDFLIDEEDKNKKTIPDVNNSEVPYRNW